ncbi:membrane protease subunit, stomatin/prohibitin [Pandoraea communis]|uniref:Membrane protease subunit, stomatin/prohibitin n=1 Tax=Pandoraea communis TaxID=2508297 RepID=A0A5E4UUW1_9BURK|nr:hypothetical protein [Pandoraea communis]VVE03716.1 membrane protease subunit, stomatin/prohibitin [Pandoraea communis]
MATSRTDSVTAVIDERIQTTAFNAEQALTKDTVPVNVDAIIFWHASTMARRVISNTLIDMTNALLVAATPSP